MKNAVHPAHCVSLFCCLLLAGLLSACKTTEVNRSVSPQDVMQAIKTNDMETIKAYTREMQQFGSEVFGRKYLMLASSYGNTEMVEYMLDNGADPGPYVKKTLDTPLHYAAGGGHVEVIEVLLKAGANVNALDNFGKTPLHWTADANQPDAAVALLNAGADPSPWSRFGTPLDIAVKKDNKEVEQALRDHGVTK